MHCVASRFGYPNYRWSQLVRVIDVLLYLHTYISTYVRTYIGGKNVTWQNDSFYSATSCQLLALYCTERVEGWADGGRLR